jgi:mercuric ion transport protein
MNTESRLATPPQRLSLGLMGLAVASSLLASTCCVLPLLLVLLGLGGAWMANLAALKPLVLPLSVLALGALAWAGYLVFRPANACAPDGTRCAAGSMTRKAFIACAAFIAALLLFPFAAPLLY